MAINVAKLQAVLKTAVEGEDILIEQLKKSGATEKAIDAAVGNFRLQKSFADELSVDTFKLVTKASGMDVEKAEEEEEIDKSEEEDDEDEEEMPAKSKKSKKKANKAADEKEEDCPPGDMKKTKKSADSAELQLVMKSNADLKKLVDKLVDEKSEATFIAKAVKDYSHVPGTSEEIGRTLKAAYAVSKENGEAIEKILKSTATALAATKLTESLGTTGSGGGQNATGAWAKIQKTASEMVQKSDGKLTKEQAIQRVMDSDPSLYAEYLSEHPAQRARDAQ